MGADHRSKLAAAANLRSDRFNVKGSKMTTTMSGLYEIYQRASEQRRRTIDTHSCTFKFICASYKLIQAANLLVSKICSPATSISVRGKSTEKINT